MKGIRRRHGEEEGARLPSEKIYPCCICSTTSGNCSVLLTLIRLHPPLPLFEAASQLALHSRQHPLLASSPSLSTLPP
eukprot:10140-Pyramimonas_sp.AAC.1